MNSNPHEQAQHFIALGGEGLSGDQQSWLRVHLEECATCSNYAAAVSRTLVVLRSQAITADRELIRTTKSRVRSRALELQQRQERVWLVCLSCLIVGVLAAGATMLFWRACEWIGASAGISSWAWEAAFVLLWIAPALAVSAVLLIYGTSVTAGGEEWPV